MRSESRLHWNFLLFPFYSRSECHEEEQLGTELSPLDRVNGVCNATNKNILTQFRSICKLKSSGRIIAKCSVAPLIPD